MSQWVSVGISALIQLVIAAYVYGGLSRSVQEHERRLNENDDEHRMFLDADTAHGEDIAKVKGHLGLNGHARGAHGGGD